MVHEQRDNFIPVSDKRGHASLAVHWTHSFLRTDPTRTTALNLVNSVAWKRMWVKCWKSKRQQTIYGERASLMTVRVRTVVSRSTKIQYSHYLTGFFVVVNPLNAELNPICYLLALLDHHFLHVSRIRVKLLTLRRLMSYIYIYIYIWSTYSWCF